MSKEAKDKAEELIEKFKSICNRELNNSGNIELAKEYSLICVDEILKITWVDSILTVEDFWQQVKQEILNRQ